MKSHIACVVSLLLAIGTAAPGQAFDSGSTGADGALNVTADTTLNLPPNGIFNFTTINVASGVTLRFNKNALNTPVYLLATGDVAIAGTIDVSGTVANGGEPGRGGPGGFDGGTGGFGIGENSTGGDGLGPGAGIGGGFFDPRLAAVFALPDPGNDKTYGNALLSPLIGGSGGGGVSGNPGFGGGGGGGAILIASNTKTTITGLIISSGGVNISGSYAQGSGGAIRLVAPQVTGNGRLSVLSPRSGRIRIDCQDRRSFRQLSYEGVATQGSQMFVFPPVVPRLSIVEAAGQSIAEGTQNSVVIELPPGSATNRTVKVRARDFTGIVPITVVVTPENRVSSRYDAQIDMSTGNPAEVSVNVVLPEGTLSRINAWTR